MNKSLLRVISRKHTVFISQLIKVRTAKFEPFKIQSHSEAVYSVLFKGGGEPCSSFHFLLLIVRGTKTDLPNNFVPLPGDVRDPALGDLELGL